MAGNAPLSGNEKSLAQVLHDLARSVPAEGLTIRELRERLGERGLLLLAMVLTIPFLLPVSLPGTSTPFGLLIALIGVGVITNRPPWLPDRLLRRRLSVEQMVPVLERGARLCARIETLIHPRLLLLTHRATLGRVNGLLLVLSALLLMIPLPLPFSNTLPAYGVLFLATGILERDGYLVVAGYVMVGLSIAYLSVVATVGTARVEQLWAH
ncbi:MAG: exopolysaccharide biosynthesis protein [Candidatus Binatia bacterium]|nr:exopolysaccharide biosynthesis protein [Candidatus Binatia bacterium]